MMSSWIASICCWMPDRLTVGHGCGDQPLVVQGVAVATVPVGVLVAVGAKTPLSMLVL